jgi:endonuclease YncB( thermonuclease family)
MRNTTAKVYPYLLTVGLAAASFAAEDEITKTPAGLEIEPVTATCEEVLAPNVVRVRVLGECALIGVQPVGKKAPYYGEALSFVRERVAGREVRVEVCPNIPANEKGQNRAVIYYRRDGKWWNLNVELISAGLAKVADVPACHVPTKSWLTYQKEARDARRGMWTDLPVPKPSTSEGPDISDFE